MEVSQVAGLAEKPAFPAGKQKRQKPHGLFETGTTGPALKQAFAMLRPDIQWKNPVMFVVEIGAFLTLTVCNTGSIRSFGQPGSR